MNGITLASPSLVRWRGEEELLGVPCLLKRHCSVFGMQPKYQILDTSLPFQSAAVLERSQPQTSSRRVPDSFSRKRKADNDQKDAVVPGNSTQAHPSSKSRRIRNH